MEQNTVEIREICLSDDVGTMKTELNTIKHK